MACLLIRIFYGHRFTDLGPFRAIRWDALERIGMADPDFGWTAEMQVKAVRLGLRCAEVPVSYRRRVGVSKITGTIMQPMKKGTRQPHSLIWVGDSPWLSRKPIRAEAMIAACWLADCQLT